MAKREIEEVEIETARKVFLDNPGISNQRATDETYYLLATNRTWNRTWYGVYHIVRIASQRLKGEAEQRVKAQKEASHV